MSKKALLGVAAAMLAWTFTAGDASAGHHSHGSYGSHGSWGSSGGWGSHGSWGSYGSYGGWGSHGSSGGYISYGSYGGWSHGSSGGYGYYGSSGGYGSYGGYGGVVVPSGPVAPPPPPVEKKAMLRSQNAVELVVDVPADAKVFVNDKATASSGASRHYTTRDLDPSRTYTYSVRAEFEHNGQKISQTKSADMRVGDLVTVSFDPSAPVTTALVLRVPSDAKVYLSGKETTLTGDVREFTTTKLSSGQEWAKYAVRVVVQRDGRELSKDETVTLKAGERRELSVDFPVTSVARTANNDAGR